MQPELNQKKSWRKYFYAFAITVIIFGSALYISNYLSDKRLEEIRGIENRIAIDILSLETQFDLLEGLSCENIAENSVLSQEIRSLAQRVTFAENDLGVNNKEVIALKEQYTLLQIKDYLLAQRVAEKCALDPVFILYFYSNQGDCDECERTGQVLSFLQEKYPALRVYAFDYNLNLSALRTLIILNKIDYQPPALVIENKNYYGFKDRIEIEEILPLERLATSTEEVD